MTIEKPSRNEDEYFVKQDAELLKRQRERAEAERAEAERRSHFMKCPKDGFDLTPRAFHGVQVETCPRCGGIWLDANELEVATRHEDHPGLLARVFGDLLVALRTTHRRDRPAAHEPGPVAD